MSVKGKDYPTDVCGEKVEKYLGKGTYGTVYLVRHNGQLKALKNIHIKGQEELIRYGPRELMEINIMSYFNHPNIIRMDKIIPHWKCKEGMGILMPLAEGDLFSFLYDKGTLKNEDVDKKMIITKDIVKAVAFFHQNNYLHLDISSSNVFIKENRAILSDFSLSTKLTGDSFVSNRLKMQMPYLPPELLREYAVRESLDENERRLYTFNYAKYIDIWALGMLIYQLFFMYYFIPPSFDTFEKRYKKYLEIHNKTGGLEDYFKNVLITSYNIKIGLDKTIVKKPGVDKIINIITGCLKFEPEERWTIERVMKELDIEQDNKAFLVDPRVYFYKSHDFTDEDKESFINFSKKLDTILSARGLYGKEQYTGRGGYGADIVYLACDLYRRSLPHAGNIDKKGRENLCLACYRIAFDLCEKPMGIFGDRNLVNKTIVYIEQQIIYALNGILYRNYLYDLCENNDDVIASAKILLSKKYLELSLSEWRKKLSGKGKSPKNISFGYFINNYLL